MLVDHLLKAKKESTNSRYIYKSKLDKSYFQHEMAYKDFKNLPRGRASDKV